MATATTPARGTEGSTGITSPETHRHHLTSESVTGGGGSPYRRSNIAPAPATAQHSTVTVVWPGLAALYISILTTWHVTANWTKIKREEQ